MVDWVSHVTLLKVEIRVKSCRRVRFLLRGGRTRPEKRTPAEHARSLGVIRTGLSHNTYSVIVLLSNYAVGRNS